MPKNKKTFVRHFRIYFKNNHPAYIVDEEGNMYVFHRVTHSKTSGGKKNWEKENPLVGDDSETMYIVKQEQKDEKKRFSLFPLETKRGVDVSYPDIKKAGSTQLHSQDERAIIATSTVIKSIAKAKDKRNKKTGNLQTHGRTRYESGKNIKPKKKAKHKRNKKR